MINSFNANKGKSRSFLFVFLFFLFLIPFFSVVSADNFPTDDIEVSFYTGNLTNFTDLADTPASYAGNAGLVVRANAGEDALEFINLGTLYYPVSSNPLSYWNSTFATFNKTYADTLYSAIGAEGNATWNETLANTLYYDIDDNVLSYWNTTNNKFNKTYADTIYSTIDEPLWSANLTAHNETWNATYNATYDLYNSTGLIKDWDPNGYIKDWNESSLIIDWNATGYIKDWTASETDPLWTANQSDYSTTAEANYYTMI